MTRNEVLLAILAASQGQPYTPVQIQKAAFLVTRNLPGLIDQGQRFEFVPYDYGPFDSSVYQEAEFLTAKGLAQISQSGAGRWNVYCASDEGVDAGNEVLARMSHESREYITRVAKWVRSLSFQQLVRAVYEQYPEMRVNSIFKD
jgi:hypothetical protein